MEYIHLVLKSPRRDLNTLTLAEEEGMVNIIILFYRCFLVDGVAEGISTMCSLDTLPEPNTELKEKTIEVW